MRGRCTDSGQLSLGLAFGFMAVLAMFSLTLHSSFVTREKMQMQQTTDFAALVAADVQRRNLDRIREINEAIEDAYRTAQELLAATSMSSPCALTYSVAFSTSCSGLFAATAPYHGRSIPKVDPAIATAGATANAEAANFANSQPPDPPETFSCDKGCNGYDSFIRNNIISAYGIVRSNYMAQAKEIVEKANERAYNYAAVTFLTPQNLPFGLYRLVQKRFGEGVSTQSLQHAYETGALKELFEINDSNKGLPLFIPKQELRTFEYGRFSYWDQPSVLLASGCRCMVSFYPTPRLAVTAVKITKTSDYTTSFLAGATYYPPPNELLKKLTLYLRDPKSTSADAFLRDLQGNKIHLIQDRSAMTTMALAKPYGGTFPRAGNLFNPTDHGDLGTPFKGAKLIGIADRAEVGGFDLGIAGRIERKDSSGRVLDSTEVYQEDFLH